LLISAVTTTWVRWPRLDGNDTLRGLGLTDTVLSTDAVHAMAKALSANRWLAELKLSSCKPGDDDDGPAVVLQSLRDHPTMRYLTLTTSRISGAVLGELLGHNRVLERLGLEVNEILSGGPPGGRATAQPQSA
jgi:hypothetical protein